MFKIAIVLQFEFIHLIDLLYSKSADQQSNPLFDMIVMYHLLQIVIHNQSKTKKTWGSIKLKKKKLLLFTHFIWIKSVAQQKKKEYNSTIFNMKLVIFIFPMLRIVCFKLSRPFFFF
jgi:hypothetical protein